MAAFLLHMLLLSVFAGVTDRLDLLRPPPVTFAAAPADEQLPDGTVQPVVAEGQRPATTVTGPRKIDPASLGVKLTATAAALIDTQSGEVLYSQGDDRVTSIASITKLMTALVLLESNPDWEAPVTIQMADNDYEGIQYLKVGDTLSARDMFSVMLVGSANNAAMALSRSAGMSREQFVAKMNSKARSLGLQHTVFVDPTGYLPENRSAAFEVARLAYDALSHAEIHDALTTKEFDVRTKAGKLRSVPSTDELLDSFLNQGDFLIAGGKTGYTQEAGYALVLRAKKGQADVIAVVLGSADSEARFQDAKSLLYWGFKTFEW
jgi:D-alanyl-D-alanine endopeptidase (penicillin-binding protein 7)